MLMHVTFLTAMLSVSVAYPSGAGTNACNLIDMRPTDHAASALENAITNSSTFTIAVSNTSYTPGGSPLVVTMRNVGEGDTLFKGFLIQARKPDGRDFLARGKFTSTIYSQLRCGSSGKGLTHTSEFSKRGVRQLQTSWMPPSVCEAQNIGNLRFQATLVTSFDEPPHLMVYSDIVEIQPMNNKVLCEYGCGVNCPSAGAQSLSSTIWPTILGVTFLLIFLKYNP